VLLEHFFWLAKLVTKTEVYLVKVNSEENYLKAHLHYIRGRRRAGVLTRILESRLANINWTLPWFHLGVSALARRCRLKQ
jgi:hypothetical protein